MAVNFIFCEGKNLQEGHGKSLDQRLLETGIFPFLKDFPFAPKIIPTGGKSQISTFIKGYFSTEIARESEDLEKYFAFRDRDFDFPLPSSNTSPSLHFPNPKNKKFAVLNRITIENYLIDPNVLANYLELAPGGLNKFGIQEVDQLLDIFEEAAQSIYYYTVARHVIGKLKPSRLEFKSTWLDNQLDLPENPDFEYYLSNILSLFAPVQTYAKDIDEKRIQLTYEEHLNILPESRYLSRNTPFDNYLTWCHGRDLMFALERSLEKRSGQKYTFGKKWWDFALQNFDYQKHGDLVELKNILEA